MDEKLNKLKSKIKKLEEENSKLKEKNKAIKQKYQEKIEKLEADKEKLKKKLESNHIIDKPFKYILDNYPEITKNHYKRLKLSNSTKDNLPNTVATN